MTINTRSSVLFAFVVGALTLRLLPHPPNFSPILPLALFCGAHFDRKWAAFAVPLGAMLLSTIARELLFGNGLHEQLALVYANFALATLVGLRLRGRPLALPFAIATVLSILFFCTTNFGVWASGLLYPRTAAGLLACFEAAIPFFGWNLAGNLFYTALLFGSWRLVELRLPRLAGASMPEAATS